MIEFSKAGQNRERGKGFEKMTGFQLLERFYTSGLQPHIEKAKEIITMRGSGAEKLDTESMDDVVRAIQIEVNGLSFSNAGDVITLADVDKYVREKFLERGL